MKFNSLFQPIKIGTMEVRNRIVVPAMASNLADANGYCTQELINYQNEKSKGGFGLIIMGIAAVSPEGKCCPHQMGLWDDSYIEGYKKLTNEVHKNGAKIAAQLHHAGRETHESFIGQSPIAPSQLPCPMGQAMPREMTREEIYVMVDKFVDAAERAKKAGFDCVELHGTHGYLIAQFLSMHANKRTDEFGGNLENRTRFLRLIIQGIRRRLGDYPMILRISSEEFVTGGRSLPETRAICKMAEELGVNAIHVSIGTYLSGFLSIAASDKSYAFSAHLAGEVKKAVKIPVIAVGRINEPAIADELISEGVCDMVAIGRQSIADPHFPNKVLAEQLGDIIPCIGCLSCEVVNNHEDFTIRCAVNQFVGRGQDLKIETTSTIKNIMVIGGGPAGLEAAWVLAKRGHKVDLYEKSDKLGGAFLSASYPPGKTDLGRMINYYINQGNKYNVNYIMNTEVTADTILNAKPDAVLLATGSKPLLPNIEGIHNDKFLDPNDILLGKSVAGKKVIVAGGGLIGAEVSEFLAEQGARKVTIIEMKPEIAMDADPYSRPGLIERLETKKVKLVVEAKITKFMDDGVVYIQDGEEKIIKGFDSVVLALGTVPYNPLEELVKGKIKEVYVVGDAVKAGNVYPAIRSAAEIAVRI